MPRKSIITIIGAIVFSLVIIVTAASVELGAERELVYKSDQPIIRTESPNNSLAMWEKEILERRQMIIPRVSGAYADELAKGVLEEYFQAQKNKERIDEEEVIKKIFDKNPIDQEILRKSATEYRISDLKISARNSKEDLRLYGNKIGEISQKYSFSANVPNPNDVLAKAMQLNSPAELKQLELVIKNYDNLISEYLKLETPAEIASSHLEMINALNGVRISIQNFETVLSDPVDGIFIISNYAGYGSDLREALSKISEYLKKNDVYFSPNDPGYVIEKVLNI
ncbi:MAG: hypothetical protein QY304_02895 [Candidatus Paceibacterota bacterium]|nr:MAG: hypothetical protein QY304_02895 [Candidatus Paceibacterota bacterium]